MSNPQPYAKPFFVFAKTCFVPAATYSTLVNGVLSCCNTCFGVVWLVLFPIPSCPLSLTPKLYTSPFSVTTIP